MKDIKKCKVTMPSKKDCAMLARLGVYSFGEQASEYVERVMPDGYFHRVWVMAAFEAVHIQMGNLISVEANVTWNDELKEADVRFFGVANGLDKYGDLAMIEFHCWLSDVFDFLAYWEDAEEKLGKNSMFYIYKFAERNGPCP